MKMAKKKKYTEALDPHKPHLGGNFIEVNPSTYCPAVWLYIIKKYSIQSVMDVGSGRGHAAKWFSDQGIKTIAVDGLQDNIVNAVYPTVLCDLTESSYNEAVDLVNCIEVVEHIEEKYINNLLDTICSGRYLFMTHGLPGQEGHHHVNCQPTEYWLKHLADRGFKELSDDSKELQRIASSTKAHHIKDTGMLFVKV
jgi:hypothetical protein